MAPSTSVSPERGSSASTCVWYADGRDALFRLRFEHAPRRHGGALPGSRGPRPARLAGYEFFIGIDGWGSVRRVPGQVVHGVLWRLTPRDRAVLDAYELLHKGLYNVRMLPVRHGSHTTQAMVYLLRRAASGRPKPGYAEMCASAAREWGLPQRHVRDIGRWSISRWPC